MNSRGRWNTLAFAQRMVFRNGEFDSQPLYGLSPTLANILCDTRPSSTGSKWSTDSFYFEWDFQRR